MVLLFKDTHEWKELQQLRFQQIGCIHSLGGYSDGDAHSERYKEEHIS